MQERDVRRSKNRPTRLRCIEHLFHTIHGINERVRMSQMRCLVTTHLNSFGNERSDLAHIVDLIRRPASTNLLLSEVTKYDRIGFCRYGMATLDYRTGRCTSSRSVNRVEFWAGECNRESTPSRWQPTYLTKPVDAVNETSYDYSQPQDGPKMGCTSPDIYRPNGVRCCRGVEPATSDPTQPTAQRCR